MSRLLFYCYLVSKSYPTLWVHGLQHTSLPYPSLSTRVCSNSSILSHWCCLTSSSSVVPYYCFPQSFPASWICSLHQVAKLLELRLQHQSFQWTFLQDWQLWALQSEGLSRVFSHTTVQKHQFFGAQQLSHRYMTTGKTIALTKWAFIGKVMSLLLNRLVKTFLPRSKRLLISWLQSPSAVILEPPKIKSDTWEH